MKRSRSVAAPGTEADERKAGDLSCVFAVGIADEMLEPFVFKIAADVNVGSPNDR